MTFGPDDSAGARITSLDEYNKCLDYLQSQGYNEIDTARTYIGGKQEAFTAEAHWKERGFVTTLLHSSSRLAVRKCGRCGGTNS